MIASVQLLWFLGSLWLLTGNHLVQRLPNETQGIDLGIVLACWEAQ
jgi:hypothetical protein